MRHQKILSQPPGSSAGTIPSQGYRFPPNIIRYAVWLQGEGRPPLTASMCPSASD
ncbi:transposase [Pandoraea sputorum]|uniref:Transposase n=1 Tax=Pandoraea sputorum TaxID=93222 RepID=A0A5E5BIH3_9BURK|nr:transposase [Pandoraea sputorum]